MKGRNIKTGSREAVTEGMAVISKGFGGFFDFVTIFLFPVPMYRMYVRSSTIASSFSSIL
jgi:hypothetical protein